MGDLGAEPLLDVVEAELGVLRDVVEEGGLDGDGIDSEVGQDLGRCDRVGDVRLARRSGLAGVGLDREVERAADRLKVRLRVVPLEGGEQLAPKGFEGTLARGPWRGRSGGPTGALAGGRCFGGGRLDRHRPHRIAACRPSSAEVGLERGHDDQVAVVDSERLDRVRSGGPRLEQGQGGDRGP